MKKLLFCSLCILHLAVFARSIGADTQVYTATNGNLLCYSHLDSSITNTTTETTMFSCTLPPLGPNSTLRTAAVVACTNNANVKTGRLKIDGTTLWSPVYTSTQSLTFIASLRARNSTQSQHKESYSVSWTSAATQSVGTSALNLAIPTTLSFTLQLATITDTCALNAIDVEILDPL